MEIHNHKYLNEIVVMDLSTLVNEKTKKVRDHYVVQCPLCKEKLHEYGEKLYIKDDFSVGYCQRCLSKFFAPEIDPNSSDWEFKYKKSNKKEIKTYDSLAEYDVTYYYKSKEFDETGLRYLSTRNLQLAINYRKYKIRFNENEVVLPFIRNNKVIYYQTRKISEKNYFLPPVPHKPLYIVPTSNFLSKRLIIVEGIFGAIATQMYHKNSIVVALLGSCITDYQLWELGKLFNYNECYIYLDHLDLSYNTLNKIQDRYPFKNYGVLNSVKGDPEDDFKEGFTPDILNLSGKFEKKLDRYIDKWKTKMTY